MTRLSDLPPEQITVGLQVITDQGRWGEIARVATPEGRLQVDIAWVPGHGHDPEGGYSADWQVKFLTGIRLRV